MFPAEFAARNMGHEYTGGYGSTTYSCFGFFVAAGATSADTTAACTNGLNGAPPLDFSDLATLRTFVNGSWFWSGAAPDNLNYDP